MINQEMLRKKVRLAKACNEWLFYKELAETLEITEHSFYNWLCGKYNLSCGKAAQLDDIVTDLIDL